MSVTRISCVCGECTYFEAGANPEHWGTCTYFDSTAIKDLPLPHWATVVTQYGLINPRRKSNCKVYKAKNDVE